ncbi:MAG: MMPL family transporter [Acidobacteria bacterium]|nr:MMPL family transporter [Acidobacteriota bacterium]
MSAAGPRPSLLSAIARIASRRYRLVFLLAGIALLLALAAASRLRFDTDVLNLLPQDDPVFQAFRSTMEDFGNFDNLLVGLELPEGAPTEPYQDFVEELGEQLRELPELASVSYRVEEPEELLRELLPGAPFYLDEEGRLAFEERLSDEGIRRHVAEVRRQLSTPQGIALKGLFKLDPLGLSEILLSRIEGTRGGLQVDWASGYYLSQDHRMLLILGEPTDRPQNIEYSRRLVGGTEAAFGRALEAWPEIAGEELPPPALVLGGGYLTAVDDAAFIQSDMVKNTITSVVGVMLLFLFVFRRLSALFYALLPLVFGLILTFGFAGGVLGRLSNATSGVAALLIGLGIDFVIVCYGRYVEERRRGRDVAESLSTMSSTAGRAVVVGAVTTTATFGAFLLTDFPGLQQMGLLTGVGILFCMAAVLCLLPALLTWSEDRHLRRRTLPRLHLRGFGTGRLITTGLRRPGWVLGVGLVLTLATGALIPAIGFEDSMSAMRPKGNRGTDGAQRVAEHFGSGFDFTMLVLHGHSLEEVLELTSEASAGAQALVDQGFLDGYRGVTSILPPAAAQQQTLEWLAAGRRTGGALDPQRVLPEVRRTLLAEGMRPEPFEEGLSLLARALERDRPIGLEEIEASEQGRKFLEQQLKGSSDSWKSVLRLYPPDNRWRREVPPEISSFAARLGPRAVIVGSNAVNERVREIVRFDAFLAGVVGLILVALLIWLDFRSLRDMALSLTPLLVGVVWMLGLMAACGLKANFMNIFVSTMIIGIGVDYGLHMIHRYREIEAAGGEELEAGLQETGKAIVAAALSTVVGFGSMSLSHYPGLRTTGYVAILGALATAVVAITIVPALLRLTAKKR